MSASDSEGDADYGEDSDGGASRKKRARGSAGAYDDGLGGGGGGPVTQAVMDLNTHLTPVVRTIIAWQADPRNAGGCVNILLHAVNRKFVPDYNKLVPMHKHMHLTRIQNRVRDGMGGGYGWATA
jgi:hypothetical protein